MTEDESGRRASGVGRQPEGAPDADTATATAPATAPDTAAAADPVPVPVPAPGSGSAATAAPPTPDSASADEPILPTAYDDAALRDAIGARKSPRAHTEPSLPEDDDDPYPAPRRRRRRTIMVSATAIMVGLTIAALIFLGRANASRYLLACSSEHVAAEQGRAFPPWGTRPLTSPEWHAIPLPPNAACKPRETEDPAELARWYYEMIVDRASNTLTSRELLDSMPKAGAAATSTTPQNPLDVVGAQLEQALLLARIFDGGEQRKDVERLQGDLEYWRATVHLRDASQAMLDAAKQFDDAASRRPRHVADASAWASFVRRLADELHAGPAGMAAVAPAGAEPRPQAPLGSELPVEPPAAGSDVAPPPAPIDAGVATGGVLL